MRKWLVVLLLVGCGARDGYPGAAEAIDPVTQFASSTLAKKQADYADSLTGAINGGGQVLNGDTQLVLVFYGAFSDADRLFYRTFIHNLSGSPKAAVLQTFSDSVGNRPSGKLTIQAEVTLDPNQPGFLPQVSNFMFNRIVVAAAAIAGLTPDPHTIYVIIGDSTVTGTGGPSDSFSFCTACGWHGMQGGAGYAFIGDGRACSPSACLNIPGGPPGTANGRLDEMADSVWHEVAEQVTDPEIFRTAGYFPEIGDMCEGAALAPLNPTGYVQKDSTYTTASGLNANINLGGIDYFLQPIWQDVQGGGCVHRLALNKPMVPLSLTKHAGDVGGDTSGDLLIQNTATGALGFRTVSQAGAVGPLTNLGTASASWTIQSIADFDNDKKADILWRDENTGTLSVWTNTLSIHHLTDASLDDWKIDGVGDFDGDGFADIVFRSLKNNETRMWHNDHHLGPFTQLIGDMPLTVPQPSPSPNNNVDSIGAGDFDGDNRADILWTVMSQPNSKNSADGQARKYEWWSMKTGTVKHVVATPGITQVLGIADVNNDSVAEMIYVSGSQVLWLDLRTNTSHLMMSLPAKTSLRYAGASKLDDGTGCLFWFDRVSKLVLRTVLDANGAESTQTALAATLGNTEQLVAY